MVYGYPPARKVGGNQVYGLDRLNSISTAMVVGDMCECDQTHRLQPTRADKIFQKNGWLKTHWLHVIIFK